MRPVSLKVEGFRSFAELALDLPAGCVSLTGENGAGKSSVIDAIDYALFGPDGRSHDPYVGPHGEMLVELELDHRGDRYRVRRTAGRRATLDVEVRGGPMDDEWAGITLGSVAESQAWLERVLGLTRETLRASALLRQGAGGAFTEATPKDRKRILANALNLTEWAVAADLVGMDRRAAEQERGSLDGTIAVLRDRIAAAGGVDDELVAVRVRHLERSIVLEASEQTRVEYERRLAAAERAVEARARLVETLTSARRESDRLMRERDEHAVAGRELETVRETEQRLAERNERRDAARAELVEMREQTDAYEVARREREALARQGDELLARIRALEERRARVDVDVGGGTCDTCGQALADPAARAHTLNVLNDETVQLVTRRDALRVEHDAITLPPAPDRARLGMLEAEVNALHPIAEQLESVRRRRYVLEELLRRPAPGEAEVAGAAAEVVALETQLDALPNTDVDAARLSLDAARNVEADLRRELDTRAREIGALEQRAETLREDRAALAQRETEHAAASALATELAMLEDAFGRDGVPAWIVEHHALPAIESEANRLLAVLGGPVTRVELRTERELKTGGTRDDALDIVCSTADGERDYGTFSGGERTRVNLALRIALARLLAHRRDADVRMLAIDEPDGLDEQGMSALVEVLRDLVQRGEFETTLLASHVPALRDAFDTAIVVERGPGGSTAVLA